MRPLRRPGALLPLSRESPAMLKNLLSVLLALVPLVAMIGTVVVTI